MKLLAGNGFLLISQNLLRFNGDHVEEKYSGETECPNYDDSCLFVCSSLPRTSCDD